MNKQLLTRAVVVCVLSLGLAGNALAQCSQHKAGADDATAKSSTGAPTCAAHQVAQKGGKDAGCCAKVLAAAGAPVMQYKVGDKTTNCPQEAAKLASDAGADAKIVYVVGTTDYADKGEALKAYATALDAHLSKLTELRYAVGDSTVTCPIAAAAMAASGKEVKYRLASFTFDDKSTAQQAATAAREAADKVQMKMVVDGKEVSCAQAAQNGGEGKSCCAAKSAGMAKTSGEGHQCSASKSASMAKASGEGHQCCASMKEASAKEQREYVVGDLKTPCEQTAKVHLAQAKIVAAYNALEEIASKPENSKAVAANE